MADDAIRDDVLTVICPKPVDTERVTNAIRCTSDRKDAEYEKLIAEHKRDIHVNYVTGVVLLAIGVFFGIFFDKLLLQFINVIGGFALKRALTVRYRILRKVRKARENLKLIGYVKVEAKLVEDEG